MKRNVLAVTICLLIVVLAASALTIIMAIEDQYIAMGVSAFIALAALFTIVWVTINPAYIRADEAANTLAISAKTLSFMRDGLSENSASGCCKIVLEATGACVVAICTASHTLSIASVDKGIRNSDEISALKPIRKALASGSPIFSTDQDEISLDMIRGFAPAAIAVMPLKVRDDIKAVLVLMYRRRRDMNNTQQELAMGFGQLLSSQLGLAELDAQTELATQMELRALQAQINPHFLFNTINTIAALIRTDPMQARTLLREFAVFYRRTLENSEDLIPVESELEQTNRYLMFERARFGEERIITTVSIDEDSAGILVPAFVIQPIVENSVQHAMRDEEPLHIAIQVFRQGDRHFIRITDDGVGMSEEQIPAALNIDSSRGTGIAIKNVDDRLTGYFGQEAGLQIKSELGKGTIVTLTLGRRHVLDIEDI